MHHRGGRHHKGGKRTRRTMKKSMKKHGKKHRTMRRRMSMKKRGGYSGVQMPLSPHPFDGQGVGTSGVALQLRAGMSGGRRKRRTRKHRRGGSPLLPPS